MPLDMREAITRALSNVVKYGDTDVFPFPFEKFMFDDKSDDCLALLMERDHHFEQHLADSPPLTIETLSPVGYTGFRRVTQIEPFWNVYFLALAISIAEEAEKYRIPRDRETIYSYRYEWSQESQSLFGDSTWTDYRRRVCDIARDFQYVVLTDIADFYPRISHHELENTLNRLGSRGTGPHRIMSLLQQFSQTKSYGLPVGGPASRILAELALADVDRLLELRQVVFCRYADDYSILCNSKSEAYKTLVFLSDMLLNEGLSLQKSKTRILSSNEFLDFHSYLDPRHGTATPATEEQKLLNLSIRYDPYSPTAVEDYDSLKDAVEKIDVLGILSREVAKTTIDQTVTKQAINALRVLDSNVQERALHVLLASENLASLAPVFSVVMRAVRGIYDDLGDKGKKFVDTAFIELFDSESHLLAVDLNLSFYIQGLSRQYDRRKEQILAEIYERTTSHLLKRQIIRVMADWQCDHWVFDQVRKFRTYSVWEKRALVVASFCLGEQGRHWRRNVRPNLDPVELLIKAWASERKQDHRAILS